MARFRSVMATSSGLRGPNATHGTESYLADPEKNVMEADGAAEAGVPSGSGRALFSQICIEVSDACRAVMTQIQPPLLQLGTTTDELVAMFARKQQEATTMEGETKAQFDALRDECNVAISNFQAIFDGVPVANDHPLTMPLADA